MLPEPDDRNICAPDESIELSIKPLALSPANMPAFAAPVLKVTGVNWVIAVPFRKSAFVEPVMAVPPN
jgi:hypothetical protein